ncbi:chemotaxis protein CheB [Azospirillum sp. 11R-A]|uniref:chemotaxis protein CheB n=1 Tax=Azospirillum sp. 11R-A TaxID=3111634 RepID=UPI003C1A91D1
MDRQTRDIVVVAASAGGVQALQRLVSQLPADLAATLFVVVHIGTNRPSLLPHLLSRAGPIPAYHPVHGQPIERGRIYVAPPDLHMRLQPGAIHLDRGPKVRHTRPAADPLFESAAATYGARTVGVVLTGGDFDATAGARAIKAQGGLIIVQQPHEAEAPSMPLSALRDDHPDHILHIDDMPSLLVDLAEGM